MGLTPSTKVISLISQEAGDDVRRALHLKEGERVVFWSACGVPRISLLCM